ncbi:MAG: inorganic phosphate transporter [Coriobacteriia bacterium]|nr:inorganic phosphate transporter [Coriobacteriia bacterium]
MTISFEYFLTLVTTNPILLVVVVLVLGNIIINGATDAPNAIATVVATRCLSPNKSIILAMTMNFLGLLFMTLVTTKVANTIFMMVDFGDDPTLALMGVAAGMVGIILWGGVAWLFGIPTSESHALIAGLTGAAFGLQGSFAAVNFSEWVKVIYGLVISSVLGIGVGWLTVKAIRRIFRDVQRRTAEKVFTAAQVAGAAGVAFMHGAQDGQKFMSIMMLGVTLGAAQLQGTNVESLVLPFWVILTCSLTMGFGTSLGGKRIIKKVAMEMVSLEKYEGFSASLASTLCIGLAVFTGIPVSTTQVSGTAIMGVAASKSLRSLNLDAVKELMLTWVLTFPGCGLIGFVFSVIVRNIFA